MSKLADFLTKHKIDQRRILAASHALEALQPEDRRIRRARAQAKAGVDSAKELAAQKVRSGRPLSGPAVRKALAGKAIARRARSRMLRAVNTLLAKKSKVEAKPSDLF
jgi:hypothetical protein